MSRVSENSSTASLNHSINRVKSKLEDLQLKGTNLKNVLKPSDNPINSVESLTLGSIKSDNAQYMRNSNFALMQLGITEKVIEQLTDIMVKAKEIAIAQSSDFYDQNIRKNVSIEVAQLRNNVLALANKRIGSRYIFSGHSTLTAPFNKDGEYQGDRGKIQLEILKDFYIPVNLNGEEVFFADNKDSNKMNNPVEQFKELEQSPLSSKKENSRDLASIRIDKDNNEKPFEGRDNLFSILSSLTTALENNDSKMIQNLLTKIDGSVSRLITIRTKIGSVYSSVMRSQGTLEDDDINIDQRNSRLVDADVAELFGEITKQQDILKTTYKTGQSLIKQNLLDFIR